MTASARSCGTPRSTSRRTSRSRAWALCSTRSTSACSRSSSRTSSTTRPIGSIIVDDDLIPSSPRRGRPQDRRVLHRRRRRRRVPARRRRARRPVLRYDELLAARAARLRVARDRRTRRRRDVLHERHHREPEGRRLLAPVDVPALDGLRTGRRRRCTPRRPRAPDRADVPRQRVGHARTPLWMAGADLLMPGQFLQGEPSRASSTRSGHVARARSRRSGPMSCATPKTTSVDFSSLGTSCAAASAVPAR